MDFTAFLVLLVISVVVSAVLHFGCKYYITTGWGSFLNKVIIAWFGARMGTRLFGSWVEGLNYKQVYIIPAILGSLAILIFAVDIVKTFSSKPK